ncbi:TonB-dependent receptor domain-containing protein [Ferruginibacter sp.]|nr:TonB-dependent receptor [Ferruginibacter sp.]
MKKLFAFLLAAACTITTAAQNNNTLATTDTIRIIQLQEVAINSVQKTAQQQLVNFFKSNNASTLEDIMSRLTELSLIRRGAYGMEPSIRYFNGGQINVQLDGMNIHGACTDKMDPATIYIEPVNLENLQVQTANTGFMNGSSIGGTVNMKMAEPNYLYNDKLTGVFSSGYQTAAKALFESLRLNYSSGKWAVAASGTYRNNKNYRSGGGAIIPFSQYEKVNYSLSVKFMQNQYNYFKADVLADDGWNIGYTALPMDVGYAAARIASFSWHKENFAKRLYKWQTKIYANRVKHFMDDSKRPLVPMHMDMPGESKTMGAFTEGEMRLNKKQKLLFRVDGSSTFLKASMTMYQTGQSAMYMLTWPDNRKDQYGISASWLWQPDSLLQLQLTGRTDVISSKLVTAEAKDHVAIFDNAFTGRTDVLKNISAQLSKKMGRKIKLTTAIGYAERLPAASELFGFYLFNASDGYDYIGNPQLKSEQSLQADLSVLYNWKRSRVQVNAYYSKVTNFIAGTINTTFSTMTIGANGVKTYINLPSGSVAGAELSGFFKPSAAIDIVTTVRYTSAKDNNKQPLPYVAPFKNINSVRYQPKRFSVQVETETALDQNKISKQYGEDKTAGYFLLHGRLGYGATIFKNNIELQAGVENIFDKKYHDHLDWGNVARPGRNFYVQLQFTFNN